MLGRSICRPAAKGGSGTSDDVSQTSSSSRASGLAVTLARPDIGVLQRAPGEQGGHKSGGKEAWVPISVLPPGPWNHG